MQLGDLIAYAEQAGAGGNISAALADLPLIARVAAVAAEAGVEPDEYVLVAIRRFEREAGPDDWISLMGAASGSEDPGKTCLQRMVRWALVEGDRAEIGNE